MSVAARARSWTRAVLTTRALALLATAGLLGAVLSVLYGIVEVDGDPTTLFVLAAASLLAATLFARALRVVVAFAIAAVLLSLGMAWYVLSLPYDPQLVAMLESNLELLSGQSILEIKHSTIWALSVTPTPMFVTWYLAVRGWYSTAAAVGGATLCYFVLTGDASIVQTVLGVVSAAALVGFGDLDRGDAPVEVAETVAVVLAVMVVAPLLVSVTPAGASGAISLGGGGGGGTTMEASIVDTDASVDIVGDISLSPEVRYEVTATDSQYWRVASFDRYTGDGWVRTGDAVAIEDRPLRPPQGQTRTVEQTFEARSTIETMPAAWRPVEVSGTNGTRVTSIGGLKPAAPLEPGDSYEVTSAVPDVSAEALASARTNDPDGIVAQYTQLPASTPDRVTGHTENVTAEATNRYERVRAVERWLQSNKEYSLDVDRPEGDVADAFIFEMERGYCTYYATTMVTMLRSQDIPARMTVGYTPGEQVGENEYVVRGYNSHAWVEVYFPEYGWVPFDPTPAGPRRAAEQDRLDQARQEGIGNIDTNETNRLTPTPAGPEGPAPAAGNDSTGAATSNETITPADPANLENPALAEEVRPIQGRPGELEEENPSPLPPREYFALGAIVLAGAVAGLRRSGATERAYRAVWLRSLPRRRGDPASDVERAFERLVYLLERRHRPRRTGETVRQYLDDIDAGPDARRVAEIRERARYGAGDEDEDDDGNGDGVTRDLADEAIELVDRIRRGGR